MRQCAPNGCEEMEAGVQSFLPETLRKRRFGAVASGLWSWVDANILDLSRQMRLSYLPPLMVYMAAGISGLTAIVGTFFVKDYLGLSAEFLAMLGFWAGIPWALKMPLGHIVDLIWRWKFVMVFLGAAMIAAGLLIMVGLLGAPATMARYMSFEAWYVLSVLLSPLGYVVQDVVADAMTVEAVPTVDENGRPYDERTIKLMHTTMQTLGRVAIIGGGVAVSLVNILMFQGGETMTEAGRAAIYLDIYKLALLIPAISVLGVVFAAVLKQWRIRTLRRAGVSGDDIARLLNPQEQTPPANWWILGGSLAFALFTLAVGLWQVPYNQEIIFVGSMAIVLFLMAKLLQALSPEARHSLIGTAVIIFVFRALPGPGAGATWWEIDVLGFDERFLAKLALIGQTLTLLGMFIFRRFMAERSIAYVVGFLTVVGTVLTLPIIGMYYGLHEWTAALTGGIVDARFIAVINTALESPLGQVAMIPMLAWIANSAPSELKATFFAVMASFTNLALSLNTLGTKYLNQLFLVSREVRNQTTGAVVVPADYSELGILLITVTLLSLLLPLATIFLIQHSPWRSVE
jgi:hypothetical protein